MAWPEAELVCRKHPYGTPQPGVCPSCLRERLLRIAGNSGPYNFNVSSPSHSFSSSPAYYHYCYSSSGCSPPANRGDRHHRVASDIMGSIYMAVSGKGGLKKSRSMAFAPREGVRRKKKGGFWNKLPLLGSAGKKPKF